MKSNAIVLGVFCVFLAVLLVYRGSHKHYHDRSEPCADNKYPPPWCKEIK